MMDLSVSGGPVDTEKESKHGPAGPNNGATQDAWAYFISKLSAIMKDGSMKMPIANSIKNIVFIFYFTVLETKNMSS
jgi:hypothetical protein